MSKVSRIMYMSFDKIIAVLKEYEKELNEAINVGE